MSVNAGDEEDPNRQTTVQKTLQGVIHAVTGNIGGLGDAEGARAELESAIAEAGLPPQPYPWLRDAASEIAAGRTVVVDRTVEALPDQSREAIEHRDD